MTGEHERIAAAFQESLVVFARLREEMRDKGPDAVVSALAAMPEGELRRIILALVVTTARSEEEEPS